MSFPRLSNARYQLRVTRYGALGIEENDYRIRELTRDELDEQLARLADTMTPLDTARIELARLEQRP
jgi:hypothetical protein